MLRGLQVRSDSSYVSPFDIATIYAGLGDRTKTFEYLEKAYQESGCRTWCFWVDPHSPPSAPSRGSASWCTTSGSRRDPSPAMGAGDQLTSAAPPSALAHSSRSGRCRQPAGCYGAGAPGQTEPRAVMRTLTEFTGGMSAGKGGGTRLIGIARAKGILRGA
jgi:hypothetical protein